MQWAAFVRGARGAARARGWQQQRCLLLALTGRAGQFHAARVDTQ